MNIYKANPDWYPILKAHAREMRSNPTEAEAFLWKQLKANGMGVRFKRQCVILDFIVDFYCPDTDLIIEVDGGYHQEEEQYRLDEERTKRLEHIGYHVLRFSNEEVLFETDKVLNDIKKDIIDNQQKAPLPFGGVVGREGLQILLLGSGGR